MQVEYDGYKALLRDICQMPPDAQIRPFIMEGGKRVSLQEALDSALNALPFTRGWNDPAPWQRRKRLIGLRYDLQENRGKVPLSTIAGEFGVKEDSIGETVRASLRELRRNSRLEEFFILPSV